MEIGEVGLSGQHQESASFVALGKSVPQFDCLSVKQKDKTQQFTGYFQPTILYETRVGRQAVGLPWVVLGSVAFRMVEEYCHKPQTLWANNFMSIVGAVREAERGW